MKNLELALAARVGRLVRAKVMDMAQTLRTRWPHGRVMALGDQLRVSLRKNARARALVLRALRERLKP